MEKRIKALRILLLALKINNIPTRKELTVDKPTVFVEFMGHIATLVVTIIPQGWEESYNVSDAIKYRCVLNDNNADETLDECISLLEIIWKEWKSTT